MKVAISVDDILQRDAATDILDALLETFEEAEVYALTHKPYRVLGPIDLRKVHSSFLTHIAQDPEKLRQMSFLAPMAGKNLSIPCSWDVVVTLSRGLGHGIPTCEGTRHLTYLYDLKNLPSGGSWREKFFQSYVFDWSLKSLVNSSTVWFSSEHLRSQVLAYLKARGVELDESQVVQPFLKVEDFPAGPKGVYRHDYYLVNTEGLSVDLAGKLMSFLTSRQVPYRFVGQDFHLESLKTREKEELFLGDRCGGELAPLLAAARGFIDVGEIDGAFPQKAMESLLSGRPVIALGDVLRREFLPVEGTYFCDSMVSNNWESFCAAFDQLEGEAHNFDPEKLHRLVQRHHESGFKAKWRRELAV